MGGADKAAATHSLVDGLDKMRARGNYDCGNLIFLMSMPDSGQGGWAMKIPRSRGVSDDVSFAATTAAMEPGDRHEGEALSIKADNLEEDAVTMSLPLLPSPP